MLAGLIDPGSIIGGDPLFDLSGDSDDYSVGIWEVYTQNSPLAEEERYRWERLGLISLYRTTCWQFTTHRECEAARQLTIQRFDALSQPER